MKNKCLNNSIFIILTGVYLLLTEVCCGNATTYEYDPSISGQIVSQEENSVIIEKEYLEIKFKEFPTPYQSVSNSAGSGEVNTLRGYVRAKYHLYNPEWKSKQLNLAFPILRTGLEEKIKDFHISFGLISNPDLPKEIRRGVRSNVKFNGREMKYDYVTFESLFEKERGKWASGIREWLKKYPDFLKILDDPKKQRKESKKSWEFLRFWNLDMENIPYFQLLDDKFPRYYNSKKKSVIEEKPENKKDLFYLMFEQSRFYHTIREWDLKCLSHIYSILYPDEPDPVGEFFNSWGAEDLMIDYFTGKHIKSNPWNYRDIHWDYASLNRSVDFLIYKPVIKGKRRATIEVSYSHLLNGCTLPRIHNVNLYFQYILKSSGKWKKFGPVYIHVWVPRDHAISLPMEYLGKENEGHHYALTIDKGSEIKENFHISMTWGDVYYNKGLYPGKIDRKVFLEKIRDNPNSPLSPAYMARLLENKDQNWYSPDYRDLKKNIRHDLESILPEAENPDASKKLIEVCDKIEKNMFKVQKKNLNTPVYAEYSGIMMSFIVPGNILLFLFCIYLMRKYFRRKNVSKDMES
jgi:hypothetical protein